MSKIKFALLKDIFIYNLSFIIYSLIMKLFMFLAYLVTISVAQDRVAEILMLTKDCDYCGMTFTGTVSVKVCGNMDCCYTPWLTGSFNEGQYDVWSGPSQLGECSNYNLMDNSTELKMGKILL